MRIRIHPETTDGKPISGAGRVLAAATPADIVELMRLETPFTSAMTGPDYADDVLRRVQGQEARPLPVDPDEAAAEFLTRLAVAGRIEFLPDEIPTDEAPPPAEGGEASCAGKQV